MQAQYPSVRLGEFVFLDQEPIGSYDAFGLPVLGVTNTSGITRTGITTSEDLSKYLRLRPERFVYNPYRVNVGSIGLSAPGEEGVVSPAYVVFGTNQDLLPTFLFRYLKSAKGNTQINYHGNRGTVRSALRFEDLCRIEIPLPPISEQRRIVASIEHLADKVENARALRQQSATLANTLIGRVLSDLYSKGERNLWQAGRLGDYVLSAVYGTSEKTTDARGGIPVLRMGNIQNGRLDIRALKYLNMSAKDKERLLLKPGDILVNRTNSAELVGKCAVFDLPGEYCFASYIIRLRLDMARAEPQFFAAYINSPIGRKYMFDERTQMTGQANVNATTLRLLPVIVPPLSEQRRILAYLDNLQSKVDALKTLQSQSAAELDALLPSILDRAFKGGL